MLIEKFTLNESLDICIISYDIDDIFCENFDLK